MWVNWLSFGLLSFTCGQWAGWLGFTNLEGAQAKIKGAQVFFIFIFWDRDG